MCPHIGFGPETALPLYPGTPRTADGLEYFRILQGFYYLFDFCWMQAIQLFRLCLGHFLLLYLLVILFSQYFRRLAYCLHFKEGNLWCVNIPFSKRPKAAVGIQVDKFGIKIAKR